MKDYAKDFGPFDGKIWLNSASEGALPRVSVDALNEAIRWKIAPYRLTHAKFRDVPENLKKNVAQLLHVNADEIILGNSATYGIHVLAQSIPWQEGDEVLVMRNDFPTDILPWLILKDEHVIVKQLPSQGPVISPQEIEAAITPRTRVVCLSHVHTFTGHMVDIVEIGQLCRKHQIIFVVNVSQSLGYWSFDLKRLPVDAITSAGFKWLCGPYGTGICWIKPELREQLTCPQAFWVNVMTEAELQSTDEIHVRTDRSAKAFDVFGTANFFNFVPLAASIEYFQQIGMSEIRYMIDERVNLFHEGLDQKKYRILSPLPSGQRSALIVFSHRDEQQNSVVFRRLMEEGIFVAHWKGNLRVSPHIFNTSNDMKALLSVLNHFPSS